ncbi:MAG: penicillin-binding transpeptidase domain-containing protein [Limnochordia bacterium]
MNGQMRRWFLGTAACYVIILGGLLYWHLAADLGTHSANPRYYRVFSEPRGTIVDRRGEPLAVTLGEEENFRRSYAAASLTHVVGYFHPRYGMTALERIYHEELLVGRTVQTTIDLELQLKVESLMEGRIGAAVALSPATGEVLALVSSPWIDGNVLAERWSEYSEDGRSPFLNRVTQGQYPPGSVIKPIVYGTALERELTSPDQIWNDQGVFRVDGRTVQNFGGRSLGAITTEEALALSSNTVFAELAVELGDDLLSVLRRFALGSEPLWELGGQSGFVPQRAYSDHNKALLGIGQGELLVTPLQMGMVAAALANRGVLMQPYLVQELRGGFRLRQITRPVELGQVLSESVAAQVRDAMVLTARSGTAQGVCSDEVQLAAKTGTAQAGAKGDHAWFIGFAPSPMPQIAVAVLVEHGGTGSAAAAPIGAAIIEEALKIWNREKGIR